MSSGAPRFETRTVVACTQCATHWYAGLEASQCAHDDHDHVTYDVHVHRELVDLPGGGVTACSFDVADPYARPRQPGYGLYLDPRWQPPWPHDHLDWPDFGMPEDPAPVVAALGSLLERARRGECPEVGCLGGHGRTGTALACLAVLSGVPPDEAVGWIRARYCPSAVETADQEAFVLRFPGRW
ncbi:MAG TPA: protein-tyrosine phosphatase family protein [Acidimicrobiales bacterium]|jgi:hypothetical protein